MKLKIPPVIQFVVAALLIWLTAHSFPTFTFEFTGQRVATFIIAFAGLYLGGEAIGSFIKSKTTVDPMHPEKASAIVDSGVYRFTRNPMYFGLALLLSAFAIRLGQPLNIFIIAGFIWYMTEMQIKPVEKFLREKFGESYEAYCRKVRRWI